MIQRIVVLKWKSDTADVQIDAAFGESQELVNGIDSVNRITLGRNRSDADHGFTHAFFVTPSDDASRTTYVNHRSRAWYLSEVINPLIDARVKIDVPEDASHERAGIQPQLGLRHNPCFGERRRGGTAVGRHPSRSLVP